MQCNVPPLFSSAECKSDDDCPYDKTCSNETCLNPCRYGPIHCGHNAECNAQNHRANCACPAGTQGNPLIACVTGVCQYNEDCRDDEACDRLNRVCRPVCHDDDCAATAQCQGKQHKPTCTCPPGATGNPYVACSVLADPPECLYDVDCPSQQACINNHCSNPCRTANVCQPEQLCSVLDSLPLRTIICKCPTDMVTNDNGQCVPVRQAGCQADTDCPDSDKCLRGQCEIACRLDRCGVNAQCLSSGHRAICSCAAEYTGNPRIECSLGKFQVIQLLAVFL